MAESKKDITLDEKVETKQKVVASKPKELSAIEKFKDQKLRVLNTKNTAKAEQAMNRVMNVNEGGMTNDTL